MDLNDLTYENEYDDEIVLLQEEEVTEPPSLEVTEEPDVLESFLTSLGISDIHKIKFEDEDGEEIERDWDELSREEQLNILKSGQNYDPSTELDDEEIALINSIRLSRMTPKQYLSSLQTQQPVQQPEPTYTVDDMSDDELFMLDLQTRVEDITEEQLQNALTKAKEDEDLFNKQMKGIRDEYKHLEDEKNAREIAEQQEMFNQQYQQFSNNINNAILGLKNIGELDVSLDNNDMDELSSFILDKDETGTSYFARALNDPDELVRMAWFALHGEDVFNQISDYYKKQISQVSKTNYQKGYEAAMNGEKPKSKVVVKKTNNMQPKIESVNDLIY